jgi:MFS transporter, YNFM family, putative membrane transport protein
MSAVRQSVAWRGRVLTGALVIMMIGLALTMFRSIPLIAAGIAGVTFGFFAGHAVASGWVGRLAKEAKGQAAALYLLAYYLGSSIVGSYGGRFWTAYGWNGVAGLVGMLLALGIAVSLWLQARERGGVA